MDKNQKLQVIARKTRQRLLFTLTLLVAYFSYVLNYAVLNEYLGAFIGESHITGSLLMFICLILFFIGLEVLFLALNARNNRQQQGQ